MKKIFTLSLILFFALSVNAQEEDTLRPFRDFPVAPISGYTSPNGSCDTLNAFAATGWDAYYYEYQQGGMLFGTSNLKDTPPRQKVLQDANFFDASAANYNYITGGLVYFAFANSSADTNLSKALRFKLYDDAGGLPGTVLATTSLTISEAHAYVSQGMMVEFKFAAPIAMPASKKFYIAVDHGNFRWNNEVRDTIAIVATRDHVTPNSAFQFIRSDTGEQWFPVNEFWETKKDRPLDVTLFIFPYVRQMLEGCTVLPVSMFNFGGTINNSQAYLNWSTAVETNNKGFYVERSKDGKDFAGIGFVSGKGNSSQITNYSYIDASLKDVNVSKTYYRLKQVDLDGKFTYSNVIELSLENLVNNNGKWKLYPNPVREKAVIELNLETASKVKAQLISRDGKVLSNTDKGVLNEGTQQFYINTQNIAKGSYILRVTIGDKTYSQLLVKE